jgi:hypothetical protein
VCGPSSPGAFYDLLEGFYFVKSGVTRARTFVRILENGWGWSLAVAGAVSLGVCTLVCGGACGSSYVLSFFFGMGRPRLRLCLFFPLWLRVRREL